MKRWSQPSVSVSSIEWVDDVGQRRRAARDRGSKAEHDVDTLIVDLDDLCLGRESVTGASEDGPRGVFGEAVYGGTRPCGFPWAPWDSNPQPTD